MVKRENLLMMQLHLYNSLQQINSCSAILQKRDEEKVQVEEGWVLFARNVLSQETGRSQAEVEHSEPTVPPSFLLCNEYVSLATHRTETAIVYRILSECLPHHFIKNHRRILHREEKE